jgi:hypothetical protein
MNLQHKRSVGCRCFTSSRAIPDSASQTNRTLRDPANGVVKSSSATCAFSRNDETHGAISRITRQLSHNSHLIIQASSLRKPGSTRFAHEAAEQRLRLSGYDPSRNLPNPTTPTTLN